MVETVRVGFENRSYDIVVGERLLAEAGTRIKPLLKSDFAIIVSDETVAKFYLHRLTAALEESGIRARAILVPPGESTKNFTAFGALLENILAQNPDRKTTLIALGGGVVGDIAGFAASVLLRGVDFIQIPTTLLAQVDSSVGGKTGVNSTLGKNLIGTFYQPKLVLADVSTLSTLSEREKKSGYAEVVKYGLINDAAFFSWLEKNGEKILGGDAAATTEAVVKSCKAKAAIVARDEKEFGERALLNFGHTFAHALEAECGYDSTLLHGEAVAIGMALAFETSVDMGLCKKEDCERVLTHFRQLGLPVSPRALSRTWDMEKLMGHFAHDKKASGGKLTFILTHGVGKAFIASDVEKSLIKQVLARTFAGV
jgi:3-dehydroquinate synthase